MNFELSEIVYGEENEVGWAKELAKQFEEGNYSKEEFIQALNQERGDILKSLWYATKFNWINIAKEHAKNVWRDAFDFFEYNRGRNLTPISTFLAEEFYKAVVPEKRQNRRMSISSLKTAGCVIGSIGILNIWEGEIFDRFQERYYHRFVRKMLYSKDN